jgi:hypothetical protein
MVVTMTVLIQGVAIVFLALGSMRLIRRIEALELLVSMLRSRINWLEAKVGRNQRKSISQEDRS